MRTKPTTISRQAVIVLGMHRSGTSAISGLLSKLGAQPPVNLMPPTTDNPRGYWESTEIMKFHDRVLESAGSSWDDWERFNPDWIDSAVGAEFERELPALLEQEYGAAGILLVKDPRLCRLLPLWLRALKELSITPKIIIPVRHPIEVSSSLGGRDKISRKRAQLIWLRHILDADASTRDVDRVFVSYSHILSDWREQVQRLSRVLDVKWPRWSGSVEAEIDEYLTTELRHYVVPDDSLPQGAGLPGWLACAYRAADTLASGAEESPDALQQLSELRAEFDRTSVIFASVVQEQRSDLESQISKVSTEKEAVSEELASLHAKHDLLQQENKANWDTGLAYKAELVALQASAKAREATFAEQEGVLATVSQELATLHEKHDLLQQENRTNWDTGVAYKVELEALQEHSKAREAALAERESAMDKLAIQLQTSQLSFAEVEAAYAQQQAQFAAAADELSRSQLLVADLEAELQTQRTSYVQLQSDAQSLTKALAASEKAGQDRFGETATLTRMVFDLEEQVALGQETLRIRSGELQRELEARLAAHASEEARVQALESALAVQTTESSALVRALELEVEAQKRLVGDYRSELRGVVDSRYWKLGSTLRSKMSGSQKGSDSESEAPSDEELLRQSGLFDVDWYLRRYPDVGAEGMDPVDHYLLHGVEEGRDPCPIFSTNGYRTRYPDTVAAGVNPLVHYIRYGRQEGRVIADIETEVENAE